MCTLEPWVGWILPDQHGFYKWVFDALGLLDDFVKQVVIVRREAGLRRWATWLGEDIGARRVLGSGRTLSPHLPTLSSRLRLLGIWLSLILSMLSSVKRGCLSFCRDQFLNFVDPFLPQEAELDLPRITGQDLLGAAWAKKSTAGGLDGWAWNEIKALPLPWFSGLAILLHMVQSTGVVYRLWASPRLGHVKEWVQDWVPTSVFSLGNGVSSVEAWFSAALDVEEVLAQIGCDQLHITVAGVVKSLTLLTGLFWTVLLVDWDCLLGLGRCTSLITVRFVLGLGWPRAWVSHGVGVTASHRDVLLVWSSLLPCEYPGTGGLEAMPAVRPPT